MQYFVKKDSIVRKIWGKSDTILFIFAGCAAEFALNKAVDWLYFTGKLPSDPLGRLFTTVNYAKKIVFSPMDEADKAINTIQKIHSSIEKDRGAEIPDWAYRDMLFMLIFYSIAAFELLERKLSEEEKEEVYNVFYRVGAGMGLKNLSLNYVQWLQEREAHLDADLQRSTFTIDLFKQYKKHLGVIRYMFLVEAQKLVLPETVKKMLHFSGFSLLAPVVPFYKIIKKMKMEWLIKNILLPGDYKAQINALDVCPR